MPPRRPTSSRANSSRPPAGAPQGDRTELKPSPFANKQPRGEPSAEEEDLEPSMENPMEEDYHTSNHFAGEGEEEPGEGTPVGDDPRAVSKEFVSLEDQEQEEEQTEEDDDNPDATRAGPPVSLHIIEGPDKGKKRRFKSVRMVLGRANGVDLKLSDQSVSRRHLELVHGDTGTVLRDLVSASGTRVNDERVDECTLKHGDVISIGKTSIRFVDELEQVKQLRAEAEAREAEAKKAEEEAKKKKEEEAAARKKAAANATAASKADVDPNDPRFNEATNARFVPPEGLRDIPTRRPGRSGTPDTKVLVYGGLGVAVVVLAVIIVIVFANKEPPPPPPPDPREELAATKMQRARTAIREGSYSDAVTLIEEAEKLKPGIDAEGLAKTAQAEQALIEALKTVRALMAEERYEEARQQLEEAPKGITAKSDEERQALDKELSTAEAGFYTKRLDSLLEQRDVESVRALIDKLPSNARPLYRAKLEELEMALAQEAQDQEKLEKTNKVLAAKRAAEKRAQIVAEAFDVVERKFDNGDYERAVLECDRVVEANKGDNEIRERARNLKRLIPQFARTYQDAQRKVQSGSLESAVRPLRKAEELYTQIGFRGAMLDAIREQLAEASVKAGKASLARRDIASAGIHFREALRLNPGDRRAQDGLDGMQEEVENLYQRAYIERDRDPRSAAEKFKIVIDTAPEGSELRRKAEVHLKELQP
ncbi:FHA domain-containing protein [Hyalangium rubrum]|uniref:FHA domain-containing protein n=1 Tax=Hyalangium rubrum TaxID=3103134 RepID=A0ABU5GX14_9BACT|nr:FHA domain-containing protein [Hyalangium sp. s54d21]MDY7225412.1 FHA domain-containing protein [Hyalangium sp. s54d21]